MADRVLTPAEMYAPEKWADRADGFLSGEAFVVVEPVVVERSLLSVLAGCARDLVRLRAERDLLRAEVKAWRKIASVGRAVGGHPTGMLTLERGADVDALVAARAAVDAFDKEATR